MNRESMLAEAAFSSHHVPMEGRTLVLIKPDAFARGLVGEIIRRFERKGFQIMAMKMMRPTEEQILKHYAKHNGKPYFHHLVDYMTSGKIVAMVVWGVDVIRQVRRFIGDKDPSVAVPGTIRGDLAHMDVNQAKTIGIPIMNLIEASNDREDAMREIDLWFRGDEIDDIPNLHAYYTLKGGRFG